MALNVRVVHARDFVRATPEGVLDYRTTERLLREIARIGENLGDYGIILDMRRSQPQLDETDLWYLARELVTLDLAFRHRTAVVASPGRFDYARFFALSAQNEGYEVKAFEAFDEAIDWLYHEAPGAHP